MKKDISFILTSYRASQLVVNAVSDLVDLSKDYHTEILVSSDKFIDFGQEKPVATECMPMSGFAVNKEGMPKILTEEFSITGPPIDFRNVELKQYLNKDCSGEGLGTFPESSVRCFNFLANQATSDWVVVAVDDHRLMGDLAGLLETLESDRNPFKDKKYKIGTLGNYPGGEEVICPGTRRWNEELGEHSDTFVCRWPIFHKSVLKEFGGVLFNQSFYHHYCDNWISYWVHMNGEIIPVLLDLVMEDRKHLVNENNPGYDDVMFRTLVETMGDSNIDYNTHIKEPIPLTKMPYSFQPGGRLIQSPFGLKT